MRVVHVAPTTFGVDGLFGGGERYPLELARALALEPGVECELVTFGPAASRPDRPERLAHPRAASARPLARAPRASSRVGARSRRSRSADVVHTHHFRSTTSRLAALSAAADLRPQRAW